MEYIVKLYIKKIDLTSYFISRLHFLKRET